MTNLQTLLNLTVDSGASDLHLIAGHPPLLRIHTILECIDGTPPLTQEELEMVAKEIAGEKGYARLQKELDLDCSTSIEGKGRFRVNIHYQRGTLAMALRAVPSRIPTFDELNLPEIVERFSNMPRGLILLTGVTGSGKSTTMASMIDYINHRYHYHIVTIEDPIEYNIESDKCAVEQRELGRDVISFASALRHVLRQDPDVILVGEMRDLETIAAAVTAAETGHLVLSTVHTYDAASTVERIIDVFPAAQQGQIRSQLANTIQGVISQVLFPRIDEPGLIPATEVLVATSAVRNCIRERRIHEIPGIIETNRAIGMQTLDNSIKELVLNGKISRDAAIGRAGQPAQLAREVHQAAQQANMVTS